LNQKFLPQISGIVIFEYTDWGKSMARQKGSRTGRCQGCNHLERVRIERLLAAGASIKGSARKFAIDYHALRRDKRHSGGPPWFCHGPFARTSPRTASRGL